MKNSTAAALAIKVIRGNIRNKITLNLLRLRCNFCFKELNADSLFIGFSSEMDTNILGEKEVFDIKKHSKFNSIEDIQRFLYSSIRDNEFLPYSRTAFFVPKSRKKPNTVVASIQCDYCGHYFLKIEESCSVIRAFSH